MTEHLAPRPWSELRDSGLLWLVNTTVMHPRGYALGLHYSDATEGAEPDGWVLMGDGTEPWVFQDGPDLADLLAKVRQLMPDG